MAHDGVRVRARQRTRTPAPVPEGSAVEVSFVLDFEAQFDQAGILVREDESPLAEGRDGNQRGRGSSRRGRDPRHVGLVARTRSRMAWRDRDGPRQLDR